MIDAPLVLLHAFPLDSRMWDGVRGPLSSVTRVITPDQRGLGRSPLPESQRPPSLDDAAMDVIAMLNKLELDRVVLGGCSMGGYVAMAVLRAAPERVAGLVLIDSKATADTDEARENRLKVADRVDAEGVGWMPESVLPALLGSTTRAERPEVVGAVRTLIEEQPPSGVSWAQRAMAARPDSRDTLRGVDLPALVVVGEEDELTPKSEARLMAGALSGSELVVVPGAGHLSPIEAPEQIASSVVEWWQRTG